jgi:hypothetical protein
MAVWKSGALESLEALQAGRCVQRQQYRHMLQRKRSNKSTRVTEHFRNINSSTPLTQDVAVVFVASRWLQEMLFKHTRRRHLSISFQLSFGQVAYAGMPAYSNGGGTIFAMTVPSVGHWHSRMIGPSTKALPEIWAALPCHAFRAFDISSPTIF